MGVPQENRFSFGWEVVICKFHSKSFEKRLCNPLGIQLWSGFVASLETLRFLGFTMKFSDCEIWINL